MTDDPRLTPADGDLRDRYAEALRLHYADEDALYCACGARIEDWDAHLADAVAAVRDTELERLRARVAELETTPVDWDAQRRRADELEATVERLRAELAEARRHREQAENRAALFRQQVADEHQRAERAETERDAMAALMERMPDTHARFSVVGSDEPPKCADWCDVCRRERIEAERDAQRQRAEQAETAAAEANDRAARIIDGIKAERIATARARGLHHPITVGAVRACAACSSLSAGAGHLTDWPCRTVAALDPKETNRG